MTAILYTLITTHITIICVTLYLHRGQAHKGIEFNPIISHFMRFWLWLTTGMVTKQWVAVHRKHHRFCELEGDPHSPVTYGIWRVLFKGALLYHDASKDKEMVNTYGVGTPSDWIEPPKPRSEGKGATHASPRLHDRRGHLRRLASGKNVWVKSCKVGDASKGAIFHDYAIKENT